MGGPPKVGVIKGPFSQTYDDITIVTMSALIFVITSAVMVINNDKRRNNSTTRRMSENQDLPACT